MKSREGRGESVRVGEREAQDNRKIDEERTKGRTAFVGGPGHCHNTWVTGYREATGRRPPMNKECLLG